MRIRPAIPADRPWIAELARIRWGATDIALRGKLIDASKLPALVAEQRNQRRGVATYEFRRRRCEIITLDALTLHRGAGTALVEAVADRAREHGCDRLIVVTTNDNLDALRFYQRRGFVIAKIRPNALEISRRLKPTIPALGNYNIPIRDEIELTRDLR